MKTIFSSQLGYIQYFVVVFFTFDSVSNELHVNWQEIFLHILNACLKRSVIQMQTFTAFFERMCWRIEKSKGKGRRIARAEDL